MTKRRPVRTAVVLALACVAFLVAAQTAHAAPTTVTDSKYYTVHSDLDAPTVREAVVRMNCMAEEYYERTKALAAGQINRKFKFMLFGTRDAYRAAGGPDGSIGVFLANLPDHPLAALRMEDRPEQLWHTVQHEGFHQFSMEVLGGGRQPMPIWLEEGLAEYFGYAQFTGEDLVPGVIPPDRLAMVRQMIQTGRFRPMPRLLAMDHLRWNMVADGVDYLHVWSLVQFLVHADDGKYRPAFEQYIRAILKPGAAPVSISAFVGGAGAGEDLESKWRAWWLAREPDATRELYARAATTALCAYFGRATAQRQTYATAKELLFAADTKALTIPDADWLPPSLPDSIRKWVEISGAVAKFEIGKDARGAAQVTATLDDGTRLVATYNAALRSRRVAFVTDALPVEIAKATDLMAQAKHADARKVLQDALKRYPSSPDAEQARKLIQQTFATASAAPVKPPVPVVPPPPPVKPPPAVAVANPADPPTAVKPPPAAKRPPGVAALLVVSARYGGSDFWVNVTDEVRHMVRGDELALPQTLSLALGVDPWPGHAKHVDLIVMVDGVAMRIFAAENNNAPPIRIAAGGAAAAAAK